MQQQLRLQLRLPESHYDLVMPDLRREIIAYTPQQAKAWHVLNANTARDALSKWLDEPDIFITPNEFYHWRRISNAAALNALFVDIDAHNGEDIVRMVAQAISAIERARIPEPNCIIYTGRGAHIYWLIERTTAKALPRWQACQRRLVELCNGDRMAADATRVLRVVGTTNSKAANYKVHAEPIHPIRYEFDWLADQVLEFTRTEIRDIRAARALKVAQRPTSQTTRSGTIFDRWYLVYKDLHEIVKYHWFGDGVAEGNRDKIIYHMSNALSWFTVSDSLDAEIEHIARQITPTLSAAEARSYCSSVLRRAKRTQATETESRYRYKRTSLYRDFQDLIPTELLPKLRAIIPEGLHAERKRETNRKSEQRRRRNAGASDRADYLAAAEANRQKAVDMQRNGFSYREIAEKMGVSKSAVGKYLKNNEQNTGCPQSVCLV